MRFSRRALAQAAIVTMSLTGAAACTPGQFPTPLASVLPGAGTSSAEPTTGPMTDAIVANAVSSLDALHSGDARALSSSLSPLAAEVGARAGIDPAELERVWNATDGTRMTAVLSALSQVGVSYRYASAVPGQSVRLLGSRELGVVPVGRGAAVAVEADDQRHRQEGPLDGAAGRCVVVPGPCQPGARCR